LTEERAAWLGYIPSLIYCTLNTHGGLTPKERFQQMAIAIAPNDKREVLKRFIQELLTGTQDSIVSRYYKGLMSVGKNYLVSYPLCYIREIFNQLNSCNAVAMLLQILNKLESHLDARHSGMEWECTVQIAIILRMLDASWLGSSGPFDIATEGINPDVAFRTLHSECDTVVKASEVIDSIIVQYKKPTLIYVDTANARFPQVEGFLVYTNGDQDPTTAKRVGFQMKKFDVKPRDVMNTDLINGEAFLIRGRVVAKNPREPRRGWSYMTSVQVRDFLGNSLLLAMPRDMLQD
jgi:hypothetical protein